jgi:alkanesulfonate monooxygenase SsuD/methylene tetrahydromethanopterin reductase-like flavin-dependent oxidoreductase (luciferase family)
MRFGLHFLLSCADGQTPAQRYRDTIDQAVRAEELGFESVWPVEQHFNQAISALPCPTLLLSAIAMRTTRLRLGTGITQMPLSHPMRVAEELATLDVLSQGRVEFGVGRGGNPAHFAGFNVPFSESRERLCEGVAYLQKAWTEPRFSFEGKYYRAENLALSPRPVQEARLPIRVAVNSEDTAQWAGAEGHPAMFAAHVHPFPKLKQLLAVYKNARTRAGQSPLRRDDVTLLMPFFVAESVNEARALIEPSLRHFARLSEQLAAAALPKCSEAQRQALQPILQHLRSLSYDSIDDCMGVLGTPVHCLERLQEIQHQFDPGRIITWFNFGGLVPHAAVLHSMKLFGSKVLPYYG